MQSSNQIRQSFLDFFRSKGHTIVPSDSVVPQDDPTLLFTNAGMNQFKKIFLGLEDRGYKRAANSQKVLRVSGKHNDLEEVGRDHTHHTFFEMLGNWSFGDYYKKEAIAWAWELLTAVWKLPQDKLYATVYVNDEEAFGFWKDLTDIDPSHISRHGEKDNFWEMGETGPCGPCSEIHMDMGEGTCTKAGKDGHVCGVNVDGCGRFVEIWNLVFIQYDRGPDGKLTELPSKHVDTGMGFERIVRVLQKKDSNYDTDLFYPVIKAVEKISGITYGQEKTDVSFRVVADHIRALTFTIGDGVLPSNEGRGYVIRRILRRAARHGRLLGLTEPFLHHLVPGVIEIMGQAYPDLKPRTEHIAMVIKNEEENFVSTVALGLTKLLESAAAITPPNKKAIPGEVLFKLYDTFGFPIDMAQEIATEQGLTLDLDGFNIALEQQKERARTARGEVSFSVQKSLDYPSCIFVGYDSLQRKTKISGIYRKELKLESAEKGEQVDITLENTPFYAEGGGQTGDVGVIENKKSRLKVLRTTKAFNGSTVHHVAVVSGKIKQGDTVDAAVDQAARLSTARHHTATHLLQAALQQVVGKHVQQQGSMVSPEHLRFDFTNFAALDPMQLDEVEHLVNRKIMDNIPVTDQHMKLAEAQKTGAMALFGEKYGEEVRVISCGDFSKELCGGTHVKHSGELGLFKIVREEAIASGVRRIEAVTGEAAYRLAKQDQLLVSEIQDRLKANREDIVKKLNAQMEELKALEKAKKDAAKLQQGGMIEALVQEVKKVQEVQLLVKLLDGLSQEDMREMADKLRIKLPGGVIILASTDQGKFGFTIAVGDELVKTKKFLAGDIAKQIAAATGGKGGGRPQLAQVGGRDDGKLKEYMGKIEQIIFT
ncbi:MAG: alanine--tRNA ligase [Candidatus Edwardsbacteria bacterium RIFOXYD12_FULL_50_11]|uniref:Alanine--tRNA ligase n=1 Tax=Candidatus Edwardsbacteria bacterium GWF2_54_11 TaxID=1817851 RepID=A0A1F5RIB5_9BACT|nr:MAG: alanine--tRNA ligase [Candidatus Edwardsbacteria bacterium RifOxyC12_full_54_24]OGF08678.1 MAG: alanine--tRNA ligase [Candidatus Edwardsbacteria bacterium RifOxyA12_full_54_48]OGF11321.1 MAG: alanine--tRNA ligase [Candidatus Edwardsbacteria bacterium GWE2_54_12]OGF14176.1 MAG: alanine--tRNA ligase [Candidatus Edwardsbacteria bacterium GWF2_54_11]OGF16737.1 MAG: alanine--tRNA ligase [Candidatus Edwardsbacteria bacterium RIFOXYD12_FULL_50_11]OGJ18136.1 MAG: alanine--tRNA ligase [Candidat